MQLPPLKLQQELAKLEQQTKAEMQQKILQERNKKAAQEILLSLQLLLDRSIPQK